MMFGSNNTQRQGQMDESDYFARLREAHEDFVSTYRSSGGFNAFNSEEPLPSMNSQQSAPRSLPRTRIIRWRISPMQSTPQDSWPAVQLTTTRWASSVIDRLPTSIFRIDSRDGHDNSNDSVVANTVETARRASMPPCEGTFHLIPEQENSNDLVPVNQLPVSPSRGKPECEICLSEYENNDRLRHLPCGHSFHVECIDRWLRTAENCPKCRNNVVRTLRRMQVQAVRRRAQSAENRSSASVHTDSMPTLNASRNQSISTLRMAFNHASVSTDEPPETRTSVLRRLHAAQRLRNSINSAMAERERSLALRQETLLEIEPAQNRASILRRLYGEQRRLEADLLSMNLASRMASASLLDSGQSTPPTSLNSGQQEFSQVSQPPVNVSSVEARRKAVEAALRRLGRTS